MRPVRPLLEDCTLSDRPKRAFYYRLRFFWIVFPFVQGVHALELVFVSEIMSQRGLVTFVLVQNIAEWLISFVWGGLESQRAWTRQNRNPDQETRLWVQAQALSILLGFILGAGALVYACVDRIHVGVWTVVAAYTAATSLRFFIELPVQVWHSKIFAKQRIYRPFVLTMLTPVIQGVALLAGWHLFTIWTFAFSQAVTVIFRVGASIYFLRQAQPFPLAWRYRKFFRFSFRNLFPGGRGQLAQFCLLGLSYSASRVGLPALVAASSWVLRDPDWFPFSFALYLAAPALRASASWSAFFHFDLARLSDGPWILLRARFVDKARLWSLLPSTYAWFWASLCVFGLSAGQTPLAIVYLLLLCWIQGFLAWFSLENFTARRAGRAAIVTTLGASLIALPRFFESEYHSEIILGAIVLYRLVPWVLLETLPRDAPASAVVSGRVTREGMRSLSPAKAGRFSYRIRFELGGSVKATVNPREIDNRLARSLPGSWTKRVDGTYELWLLRRDEASPAAVLSSLSGIVGSWDVTPADQCTDECIEEKPVASDRLLKGLKTLLPPGVWLVDVSRPSPDHWNSLLEDHERRFLFRAVEAEHDLTIRVRNWEVLPLYSEGAVYGLVGIPLSLGPNARLAVKNLFAAS